jgi:hypothetical protein
MLSAEAPIACHGAEPPGYGWDHMKLGGAEPVEAEMARRGLAEVVGLLCNWRRSPPI